MRYLRQRIKEKIEFAWTSNRSASGMCADLERTETRECWTAVSMRYLWRYRIDDQLVLQSPKNFSSLSNGFQSFLWVTFHECFQTMRLKCSYCDTQLYDHSAYRQHIQDEHDFAHFVKEFRLENEKDFEDARELWRSTKCVQFEYADYRNEDEEQDERQALKESMQVCSQLRITHIKTFRCMSTVSIQFHRINSLIFDQSSINCRTCSAMMLTRCQHLHHENNKSADWNISLHNTDSKRFLLYSIFLFYK